METGPQNPKKKSNIAAPLKNDINSSLNSNLESINIVKILPCNTTEEILESVFDKKESFGEPIDSILNKEFTIEGFLKSQTEEDALTDIIYKKEIDKDGEEMIAFPQKIKKSNTPPHLGKIGGQTSKYHKENILEHIAMVVAGIRESSNNNLHMQLVALLHDAGKKYTGGTNKIGDICFFGHEKVSAYLAAVIYRQLGFTKEEAEPYVRIIHDHMLPFERLQNPSKKEKYRELYGDYVTDAIIMLNKNDLGITEEDIRNQEKKSQKDKLIGAGEKILRTLKTEDFRKE